MSGQIRVILRHLTTDEGPIQDQTTTLTFAESNTKSDISTNLALLTPHSQVSAVGVCIQSGACGGQHYLKSIMTIKYGALRSERYFLRMRSLDGTHVAA